MTAQCAAGFSSIYPRLPEAEMRRRWAVYFAITAAVVILNCDWSPTGVDWPERPAFAITFTDTVGLNPVADAAFATTLRSRMQASEAT
jgi:hypothetical protein